MFSKSRYGIFFTVVYVYIIGSFVWWWWLLHTNNQENFHDLLDRERLVFLHAGSSESDFINSDFYKQLYSDFRKKSAMLVGEGVVFITLISIGFLRIRNTFRDEIALTRQQNNFLLSITHELKSPLASLKLSMQTLQKHELSQQRIHRLADISLMDVDRLELLVENILLASKMDSSDFQVNKEPINLSEIARTIYDRLYEKYHDERVFSAAIEDQIYILGDRLIFSSVIYNLMENAVKYSGLHDQIRLILRSEPNGIELMVEDTGIGISDDEKQKVFGRFYRVGSESTRTTKGTGLGLFIVKQAVSFHNGTIQLTDNQPRGSRFIIHLPTPV
jgi:signal transduction histidine kinase